MVFLSHMLFAAYTLNSILLFRHKLYRINFVERLNATKMQIISNIIKEIFFQWQQSIHSFYRIRYKSCFTITIKMKLKQT